MIGSTLQSGNDSLRVTFTDKNHEFISFFGENTDLSPLPWRNATNMNLVWNSHLKRNLHLRATFKSSQLVWVQLQNLGCYPILKWWDANLIRNRRAINIPRVLSLGISWKSFLLQGVNICIGMLFLSYKQHFWTLRSLASQKIYFWAATENSTIRIWILTSFISHRFFKIQIFYFLHAYVSMKSIFVPSVHLKFFFRIP